MAYAKATVAGIVLTVFFLFYASAYLYLVERRIWFGFDGTQITAEYRIEGSLIKVAFMPAHAVDRLIRPKFWTTKAADPYDAELWTY